MQTNEEQVTQLLGALKAAAQDVCSAEEKAIAEGLVADASKAWDGFIQSHAEKAVAQQILSAEEKKALKIGLVSEGSKEWEAFKQSLTDNKIGNPDEIEKMDRLKKVFDNWKSESTQNLASAFREMNLLLNEANLIKNIDTSREAGKEEIARKAENKLEQLRTPADVMVAQRWESNMNAIQDFEENPLRKLMKDANPDVLNGVLEQLNSEPNPQANQERYVDALIRDGVQGALTEKLQVKASLLTDRDYYRREEGFDENDYGSMKTGLMLKDKDDEILAGRNAIRQATEKLSGLSEVLEVKDNKTVENISRGRLFRASVALYNSIPLPQATGANVSGKSTPGEVYRLYEACQSNAARTILSSWETMPTFSDFYQDQKPRMVSPEVKEALVNHVIQKNKLTEIPGPNRYEVLQSAQKGSDDKKETVYRANSVEVMRSFSEIVLEKITEMRNEHPAECIQILNQLGAAYEKVKASEDFYASPEIRNAVNKLVELKPGLLEDPRFAGGLLQFNQVSERHFQEPLNLGEQNNSKLQERTKTFDPFLNTVTFKNMGNEVGKKFSMAVDKETAAKGATQGQKFFRWLNSPSVLLQLKEPLSIAVDDRVPSTIEFKDGSRIRISPTGNLKLEGFPLERLRSFSDAMGVRSMGNDVIKATAESEVFHQQFMREIGHSEIPYTHPSQLERMRSATSTRSMQNLQRSPEMAESRRERRLAKKLSKESIEEAFESEKRKSSEISGESLTSAPRKRTRFGRKPSNESLTSEAKDTRVGVVMGRKGQVSPRNSDSDSVDSSLSPSDESSVSPRSESSETDTTKKSVEVRFSRGASESEEKQHTEISEASAAKSEEEQLGEVSEATAAEEEKQNPIKKILGIIGGVMSSSVDAGALLVRSIGDFIRTRVDQRREAMTNAKPDDEKFPKKGLGELADMGPEPEEINLDSTIESKDFDQMLKEAVDLQAGNDPSAAGVVEAESGEIDPYESVLLGDAEEVAAWKATRAEAKQKGKQEGNSLSRESMASEQGMDSSDESMADEVSEDMERVSLLDTRASRGPVGGGGAESISAGEKGATAKEPGGFAGFLRTIAKVWNETTVRFGAQTAGAVEAKDIDTTAVMGASAGGVAKREFNEVTLLGFAQTERNYHREDVQKNLKEWHKAFESQLQIESGSFESPPIRFSGGQSIEVKDKDVVMRGFSSEMLKDFNRKVFNGEPPTHSISVANSEAYAKVKDAMGNVGEQKGIMSRLTSVGLFFQKLWSDAKDFVFGTATSPEVKSVSNTTKTSSASSSGSEATFSTNVADTRSQPAAKNNTKVEEAKAAEPRMDDVESTSQRDSTGVRPPLARQETSDDVKAIMSQIFDDDNSAQNLSTSSQTVEQKDTKTTPDPRRITVAHSAETSTKPVAPTRHASASPTANGGPGQSWMCVKVTVKQEPDFTALKDTLDKYASDNKLPPVRYSIIEKEFHADVNDPQGGKITMKARGQQVEITKVNGPDSTLEHMANILTALPPAGERKDFNLEGRQSQKDVFNQKYEQSLTLGKGVDKNDAPSLGGSTEE